MFAFEIDPDTPKPALYDELLDAARALTEGEADSVANMANIAALIAQYVPDLNWAGFYRVVEDELVLGPFIGKPACIRIGHNEGVCGAAWAKGITQVVADVHAFPGHIACDGDTRSELVVPVIQSGRVTHVIDLDSPSLARFDKDDQTGIENIAKLLDGRI